MRELQNKIMLITYPDSLGKNLNELSEAMDMYFKEAVGGIHILPFFPSSGDRGFAPTRYDIVDPSFGDYNQIKNLAKDYNLMFDFMVNHLSRSSKEFQDYKENGESSQWHNLFLNWENFWGNSDATEKQIDLIYKRKPKAPKQEVTFADGKKGHVWCTFGDEQIDLDVRTDTTLNFIKNTVTDMCANGASVIRLDAFAYAIKKIDTNCFFIEPDIWDLLNMIAEKAAEFGATVLPEIHEHYSLQLKLADKGFWVYDFALPMLVLHALHTGRSERLCNWLNICPKKQFTTLDTHDGIGVVDAADLLTPEEIDETKELLFQKGANVKKKYNSAAYNNLDIYQINCTYYSALGNNDDAYFLARAIQFFAPGIPQVYYVGMLAGENDIALLESSKEGRNINRHSYSLDELESETKRPIVMELLGLMEFRNNCKAFAIDGECIAEAVDDNTICITRIANGCKAILRANLRDYSYKITLE